jgi:hypothetical protein
MRVSLYSVIKLLQVITNDNQYFSLLRSGVVVCIRSSGRTQGSDQNSHSQPWRVLFGNRRLRGPEHPLNNHLFRSRSFYACVIKRADEAYSLGDDRAISMPPTGQPGGQTGRCFASRNMGFSLKTNWRML